MLKKNLIIILGLFIIIGSFSFIINAQAATTTSIINPNSTAYKTGNYQLSDFVGLTIIISKWILGIVGSLALIMFIYGGFMFLISAGSADKITQAKKIIIAATIGLIIVFASYLIIKFVMSSMGLNWNGSMTTVPSIVSPSIK